jgi:poly(3-hydroxybutyrate) depolymerase
MATGSLIRTGLLRACPFAAIVALAGAPAVPAQADSGSEPALPARQITITYTTHDGHRRNAYVLLPHGYRPGSNPAIPLVISPHGRAVDGKINTRRWGNLPTTGNFAVVNPDGYGRRLPLHSWGFRGQIDDLARMPGIAEGALPWLRIDRRKIYAAGGSMGGHETLLLLGQHPKLLKGAVAIDPVTDFLKRYDDFALSPSTKPLQALARLEVGGTPATNLEGYVLRSPSHWVKQIAESSVPLQLWWSTADLIVKDQIHQTAHFYQELEDLQPKGRLDAVTGTWAHSATMRQTQLPAAMRWLGLIGAPDL